MATRVLTEPQIRYREKLKDPRWQKLRLQVFERDCWMCQICYDEETTLAVHHRYYNRNMEPWDYPLEALVTLCEDCHASEREQWAEYEALLLRELRKTLFADDLRELALGFSYLDSRVWGHQAAVACRDTLKSMVDQYNLQQKAIKENRPENPSCASEA